MLETDDLPATIAFYRDLIGFEPRGYYPDEKNACWASLWNGDIEIAFGLKNLRTDIPGLALTGSLYFHISDVAEQWERLRHKAEVLFPVVDRAYKMREFGIKDCNGYALIFGEDISNE